MFRKWMFAAALAAAAASAVPVTADAAPYRVVRWAGSGFCQVWDYGVSYPVGIYTVMSGPKASIHRAMHARHRLLHHGGCVF